MWDVMLLAAFFLLIFLTAYLGAKWRHDGMWAEIQEVCEAAGLDYRKLPWIWTPLGVILDPGFLAELHRLDREMAADGDNYKTHNSHRNFGLEKPR